VALVYSLVLAVFYALQTRLQFPANRAPAVLPVGVLPGFCVVAHETGDGVALRSWYRAPEAGFPTLLFFHGNGGNLSDHLGHIARLARPGYGVFALEYRGYGGNPGVPSERGFVADARSALAFLAGEGIHARDIVIYGFSIGTGVAARIAQDHAVRGMVLDSPFTSVAEVGQSRYPWLPVRWLLRSKFNVLAKIADYAGPLLVLQGGRDRVVPRAMGQAVFARANEPKWLWCARRAGHMDVLECGGEEELWRFVEAFK